MPIVLGAHNCGFGPAAELVAVSRLLRDHEWVFVGDGVAAAFARRNPDAFDDIREMSGSPADSFSRGELLQVAATAPHYLLAPGLTALHESLALDRLPLAIHEQHAAHVYTMRELDGTEFGRGAARFGDVLPDHPVPEDDFAGTAARVEIAARIREDDDLYAVFRRTFNERIEHYVSLTSTQRREGVEEPRKLLDGEPVQSVLARIFAEETGHPAATRSTCTWPSSGYKGGADGMRLSNP